MLREREEDVPHQDKVDRTKKKKMCRNAIFSNIVLHCRSSIWRFYIDVHLLILRRCRSNVCFYRNHSDLGFTISLPFCDIFLKLSSQYLKFRLFCHFWPPQSLQLCRYSGLYLWLWVPQLSHWVLALLVVLVLPSVVL